MLVETTRTIGMRAAVNNSAEFIVAALLRKQCFASQKSTLLLTCIEHLRSHSKKAVAVSCMLLRCAVGAYLRFFVIYACVGSSAVYFI